MDDATAIERRTFALDEITRLSDETGEFEAFLKAVRDDALSVLALDEFRGLERAPDAIAECLTGLVESRLRASTTDVGPTADETATRTVRLVLAIDPIDRDEIVAAFRALKRDMGGHGSNSSVDCLATTTIGGAGAGVESAPVADLSSRDAMTEWEG